MLFIRKHAFARAGLIGNPSDGYGGRTLSIIVPNFRARVVLYEWDDVEIVWSQEDKSRFGSVRELSQDVRLHGYYGGMRLIKATIKRFVEYCDAHDIALHERNFAVRYESDIPRQVGLGGSSAIIIAALRALMEFYNVEIPLREQPSLALAVETDELGIQAGLQDRVIQVYEGAVLMDFAPDKMSMLGGLPCGEYERLDTADLPELYLAYWAQASEPTEVVHNDLRARFDMGETKVHAAMKRLSKLALDARDAIRAHDTTRLGQLIDANFEIRRSIVAIPRNQVTMIETARGAGATAKFPGSGGAIIGTIGAAGGYPRLEAALADLGSQVIRLGGGPEPAGSD